jgi:hypothetical protein
MKTVIIRRQEVLNHLPKEIRAGAKIKIGSIYVNRQPLKGLDGEEENKILSKVIDVPPGHEKWPEKTKDFWASLNLKVPFEGVELNIATDENGMPENVMDFIHYQWCKKHRQVAANEEEMKSNSEKKFYIYDPAKDLLKKHARVQVKKDADKEFIKLTGNFDKMRAITRVLTSGDPSRLSEIELENNLYELKEASPERFLRYALDADLELRAEIEEMVEHSVLRRIGNQVIFEDETLGEDIKDTIIYFKNKKNSGAVNTMRARLKEVQH